MKNIINAILFFGIFACGSIIFAQQSGTEKPLRLAVAGLSHGHAHGVFSRVNRGDITIVGIAEADKKLAQRFADQYGFSMDMVYPTIEEMLDSTKPTAVAAFNAIDEHLAVVQACAPRRIHVMVEKPLAATLAQAQEMEKLAKEHHIQLLVNYETTWYATNHKTYDMVHGDKAIGDIRKIVVHDGHQGPKEIGCEAEFLAWLTDPVKNGGGAVMDFGCYGANLITWLMNGERPTAVLAVTQTIKPEIYPKVDDEATIIVTYPKAQGIIQASWNWPFGRKDMEVYGQTGYILADNRSTMRVRLRENEPDKTITLDERPAPVDEPFAWLAAVLNGTIKEPPNALSSLENNMVVIEILEAAKQSARTGQVVRVGKM